MTHHPATNPRGRLRSRVARVARQAERAPQRLYAYGEVLVGIALVIGASLIVTGLYLWILLAARIAEILT